MLAFPPLFQDFNFYFRLINFLSSWRQHKQVGKSLGPLLPAALLKDPVPPCPTHLGHPCEKAWFEKWALLLLQIHSLSTQPTFFRIPREIFWLQKGARQSPARGHEPLVQGHEPPGSNTVRSVSHIPVFQGNCSGPAMAWVSFGNISAAGSGALEVLMPVFSGWPGGKGTLPPRLPSMCCCVSGEGGSRFWLPVVV